MTTPKQYQKNIPMPYRKNPVVHEAVRITKDNCLEIEEWADKYGTRITFYNDCLYAVSLEGTMRVRAEFGDWIVKGVDNRFRAYKPGVFAATYQDVEAPHPEYVTSIAPGPQPRAFITPNRQGGVPKRVGLVVRDGDTWAIQGPDTLTTLNPTTLRQLADTLDAWNNDKESHP